MTCYVVKRSQRRVTFHLPDGSQESCSDSGLGDHEPVGSGSLLTQPLPLVQAQDDFYEQASPDKRTEADGNSDPNSDGPLGPRGLVEATEMCTQECLVLGHSDNCWMPPTLGTYQQPKSPMSNFGSQREWGPKDKLLNGHTLTRAWKNEGGRSEHFGDRKQFGSGEGHFTSSGMADIPLTVFTYLSLSAALRSRYAGLLFLPDAGAHALQFSAKQVMRDRKSSTETKIKHTVLTADHIPLCYTLKTS
ncbi:hypothetical protein F2P81_004295 [Scophthalmus maximus]|uniref:Protocadherin-9 n=1 Tax=Scophthalmus maximus TaxID=52904 RepID=A0A6A4TEV1_SCOMX|nr:hypothetical protein F2P81_004295 [Scophthalmus maximus]